jgi:hypothetical protein
MYPLWAQAAASQACTYHTAGPLLRAFSSHGLPDRREPTSRSGHNWRGGGTVDGTRSLDVTKLARTGFLSGWRRAGWQWTYRAGAHAWVDIEGGRDQIILSYRVDQAARTGGLLSSGYRSNGLAAVSVASDLGSSAMYARMASIAAAGLPSSTQAFAWRLPWPRLFRPCGWSAYKRTLRFLPCAF